MSEVLIARASKDEGLSNSMLGASAIAHVVAVGVFVFLPAWWFGAQHEVPETIMQISLGGPIGPNDGGVATLSARAIQTTPLEPTKAVEPVRPPSATAPEMILPTKAPPKKIAPTKTEAKDPKGAKPTVGKEVQQGTAIADTKAKGLGFGLSSGGGGSGGHLEVSNFCCPEYLTTMTAAIRSNWNSQQGAPGRVHLRFVIQKDGRIVDITVEQSSGVETLDLYARRALILTKLPPLPAAFFEPALAVHLYFEYSR